MIKGSCCCGNIKFELTKQPIMMGTCHCSRCRKSGSSTSVFVEKDSIRWIQGKELVATHIPEPPFKYLRNFCSRCGTSLGEILSSEDSFPIAANCLDDYPIVRNQFHEFVDSKPAWYHIHGDDLRFSDKSD
jgi:hypothetical protein